MSQPDKRNNDPRWGSHDRPQKAEAIWQILHHIGGTAIGHGVWIDLGCGSGGIAAALAPRVEQMMAIDPEPWQRWQDFQQQQANLHFYPQSVELLTIADNSADVVICNQVYEHVADPQRLINEIYRILKPGGYGYFAGPNLLWPIEPHVFWPIVHWLPRNIAVKLMTACKSKGVLDANSATWWQLRRWLHRFTIYNGVPIAVAHLAQQRGGINRSLYRLIPPPLIDWLTPISPAFIFVIHKKAKEALI
jgi:ubiquinone/menaquinone biosynthesis C-methylase UbiE